jgi:hypothetical protein
MRATTVSARRELNTSASTFVAWAERWQKFDERYKTQLCEIVDACGEQYPENDGFTSDANSVDRALLGPNNR